MADDPVKLKHGVPGDPMFDACVAAMDAMRAATIHIIEGQTDPRDGLSVLMSAAMMFAGTQAGTLLAVGALRNQDRRRLNDAALRNFHTGIKHCLVRSLRAATEEGGRA